MGDEQIKVKLFRSGDELVRTFSTEDVKKIEYRDGKVEWIDHALEVTPALNMGEMRKQGIKINFFSPLSGHFDITYERNLRPGSGYEVTLGLVGVGKNKDLEFFSEDSEKRDAAGFFVSGGYKFQTKPTYRVKQMRYTHLMQGWYIKPTASAGHYAQNRIVRRANIDLASGTNLGFGEPVVAREQVTFGALELRNGRQWVFSNRFFMSFEIGLGYSMDNSTKSDEYADFSDIIRNNYAARRLSRDNTGFAYSIGLHTGFLF
jgi:hypothetical protein